MREQRNDGATELSGLARACRVLAAGGAVVVPNPAPLTYGVVATTARVVNEFKRRPAGRSVAVSVHDRAQWRQVAACIDLPSAGLGAVIGLLKLRLSLLVPLRARAPLPCWAIPAEQDDYLAIFNGFWAATARLWRQFPRLFGSSANLSGRPPAATAAQAVTMFGSDCPVVDGGTLNGPPSLRMASTMVRIDRAGRLGLHRSGAQDVSNGRSPEEFLRQLARAVGLPLDATGDRS